MPNRLHVLPDEPVTSLADHIAAGGGLGLAEALRRDRADVIAEVERSGLRGRGGAGFLTGRKWASVLEAVGTSGTPAVVCNAAEGEPGTYKDRALMARNPWAVVEGLCIAMHAVGAPRGVIATKERYPRQAQRLTEARDAMAEEGFAGAAGVEILLGPDEYLYGEESGLLEVVEGKLPLPRILPPYMYGLQATMQQPNPTVVNNVETLAHVPGILREGADRFREQGTVEAPGTMVFTVVGDVDSPGVYELPLGTPLGTLIVDIAGARDAKAIYSGTSNTVIVPGLLDLPLDFDSFAEAGTGLGSGGFVVYGAERCIVAVTAALSRFLAVESCGQCPPCKLHGVELFERLQRLCREGGEEADLQEIRKRCALVTDSNRCYLPVGHALLVQSTLDAYADEFTARLAGPCDHPDVDVPKIIELDDDTGEVVFDRDYDRKRMDWSYGDDGDANSSG
ncbi:MAG: SLBB domain-containing protein [Euzebyaceae bacterium]|jgi:NADH:ubiquinone oxidoreductase subunit F (NADH-binding)|nr:SLBB domain-containing protein [Euzebyaceae bacterium]